MARHGEYNGDMKSTYNILVRISGGKRPIGRPRRTLDNNIKIEPK
jgi:hypothetical protein